MATKITGLTSFQDKLINMSFGNESFPNGNSGFVSSPELKEFVLKNFKVIKYFPGDAHSSEVFFVRKSYLTYSAIKELKKMALEKEEVRLKEKESWDNFLQESNEYNDRFDVELDMEKSISIEGKGITLYQTNTGVYYSCFTGDEGIDYLFVLGDNSLQELNLYKHENYEEKLNEVKKVIIQLNIAERENKTTLAQ